MKSLLALVLLAGCGSVSSNDMPDAGGGGGSGSDGGGSGGDADVTGDFSVTVVPTAVDVPIASSEKVTVAIARTGNVGDVMLSATGLPQGITATFAPNPVPANATSSELTISVAGGSAAGTSQIQIVGTAGDLEHSANLAVTAKTITVTGKVRGDRSGVTVRIVGKNAVTSGTNGTFTFTDVTPPYDIYTSATAFGGVPTITYYDNLTRPDPIVDAASSGLVVVPIASTGTISGVFSNSPNLTNPKVIAWGDTAGKTSTTNDVGSYSFTASWPQASTKSGTLHGLQWTERASGAPNTFLYDSTTATLTAGQSTTVNLNMATATAAALTGTISAPSGYPTPTITLTQQLGNTNAVLWTAATTNAAASIPVIAAGKSALHATTTTGGATSSFVHPGLGAATDVTFALAPPAQLTAPINAATGVTTATQFSFSGPTGVVHSVSIGTSGSATTKAAFRILTTATTVQIPQVPELAVPGGQPFSWAVNGYGPAASIDDAASTDGLEGVSTTDFTGPRHLFTSSAARTFTSQ